jgi:lipopolysaccharide export system permease protein
VTAERGAVARESAMAPVELTLFDGLQQLVPAGDGGDVPSEIVLRFREFETAIAGSNASMGPRGEDEREMTLPELWRSRGLTAGEIDAVEIEAELAGRLVRILSLPFLPFMAVPLALGRIRGQRSYGLVIGLGALIVFHQVLQFGEALADNGEIGAGLGLWLPFAVFGAVSLTLFARAATRVPDPKGAAWLDRVVDHLVRAGRRLGLLAARRA